MPRRRPRHHILTTDTPREKHAEYTYCDQVAITVDAQGAVIKKLEYILPNQVAEAQKAGKIKICVRCSGEFHWDAE